MVELTESQLLVDKAEARDVGEASGVTWYRSVDRRQVLWLPSEGRQSSKCTLPDTIRDAYPTFLS